MQNHIVLLVFCIIAGCIPMTLAEYPGMNGTWKSTDGTVILLNDTINEMAAGENIWVVDLQNEQVFSGYKIFTQPDGTIENQTFVGIINPDGKTISFIDQPGGWAQGTLTDTDTLFIAMTNPGKSSVPMAITITLHRQK